MQAILLTLHVLVAICLVALVLLQHGKGADAGAAFGSGSANTMFGSQGPVPFLVKMTTILAAIFFATSLTLSYISSHASRRSADAVAPFSITAPQQNPIVPPIKK